ncbi:hypothetical protein ABE38_24610 [Brevibacillus agri]|nr:hypothetical protein [Brevibacillus agri]
MALDRPGALAADLEEPGGCALAAAGDELQETSWPTGLPRCAGCGSGKNQEAAPQQLLAMSCKRRLARLSPQASRLQIRESEEAVPWTLLVMSSRGRPFPSIGHRAPAVDAEQPGGRTLAAACRE